MSHSFKDQIRSGTQGITIYQQTVIYRFLKIQHILSHISDSHLFPTCSFIFLPLSRWILQKRDTSEPLCSVCSVFSEAGEQLHGQGGQWGDSNDVRRLEGATSENFDGIFHSKPANKNGVSVWKSPIFELHVNPILLILNTPLETMV